MAAYAGFMTHVTCRQIPKNRDQLLNPTLGNRVWVTFLIQSVPVVFLLPALTLLVGWQEGHPA